MAEARVTTGEGWRFAGEPRQDTVGAELTGLREHPQKFGLVQPHPFPPTKCVSSPGLLRCVTRESRPLGTGDREKSVHSCSIPNSFDPDSKLTTSVAEWIRKWWCIIYKPVDAEFYSAF